MQLTNNLRLPEALVAAISNDVYTKGDADISVTGLLTPPQIVRLREQHKEEITEDASERIWSLLGQAVHSIIERAADAVEVLSETTIYAEYGGWKIKGTADHVSLSNGELCDFKVTTVWKVLNGVVPPEWVAQTNIYRRMLMREKGVDIRQMAIIAILRDWSKREAERRADYPAAQVVRLEVPLWSADFTDNFILSKVREHQETEPRPCEEEEIWGKPAQYAVMKRGRQSAVRVYNTHAEALDHANSGAGMSVVVRPGVATRCESYCPVAAFCPQWADDPRNRQKDRSFSDFIDI